MKRGELRLASARLVSAWFALSMFGYFLGPKLVECCFPLFRVVLVFMAPELSNNLRLIDLRGEMYLQLDAHALRPILLSDGIVVPALQSLPSSASVVHILVPLVIFYSVVLAWPVRGLTERLSTLAYAVPGAAFVLALTTPPQLVGLIESGLQVYVESHGGVRPNPFILNWMLLMEGGGNWALPIAVALLAIIPVLKSKSHSVTNELRDVDSPKLSREAS